MMIILYMASIPGTCIYVVKVNVGFRIDDHLVDFLELIVQCQHK